MFKHMPYLVLMKPPVWLMLTISLIVGIGFGAVEYGTIGLTAYDPVTSIDILSVYRNNWERIFEFPLVPGDRTFALLRECHNIVSDAVQILHVMTALSVYPEQYINYLQDFTHTIELVINHQRSIIPADLIDEVEPVFTEIQNAVTIMQSAIANLVQVEGVSDRLDYSNVVVADSLVQIESSLANIFRGYCTLFQYAGGDREYLIEMIEDGKTVFLDHSFAEGISFLHVCVFQNPSDWWFRS